MRCDHVFGPYFRRVPFKVYWIKCFKCGERQGPYWSKDAVRVAHHANLPVVPLPDKETTDE